MLRERDHTLALGGWANPHADAERQVDFLVADQRARGVLPDPGRQPSSRGRRSRASSAAAERRGLTMPGLFGVFYYRSANPRTLDALKGFLPVPVEG